jgi:hypothetical protein
MEGNCTHLPKKCDALVVGKEAADVLASKRAHVGVGVGDGDRKHRHKIRSLREGRMLKSSLWRFGNSMKKSARRKQIR